MLTLLLFRLINECSENISVKWNFQKIPWIGQYYREDTSKKPGVYYILLKLVTNAVNSFLNYCIADCVYVFTEIYSIKSNKIGVSNDLLEMTAKYLQNETSLVFFKQAYGIYVFIYTLCVSVCVCNCVCVCVCVCKYLSLRFHKVHHSFTSILFTVTTTHTYHLKITFALLLPVLQLYLTNKQRFPNVQYYLLITFIFQLIAFETSGVCRARQLGTGAKTIWWLHERLMRYLVR